MSVATEDLRAVLVLAAEAMSQQILSAPPEDDRSTGRIGRRESLDHARHLQEYLRALPASDPRLLTIAAAVDDLEEVAELVPDDVRLVPGEGSVLLDYLAAQAEGVE